MFVPVSPSGTGKTFSRLTSSWLAPSQLRLPSRARLKSRPSTTSGSATASASASGAVFMHPLDEHVHLTDRYAEQALDLEPDGALEVLRHGGDAGAVLDDHVDVDDQLAGDLMDVDAPVQVVAAEEQRDAVAEPARRHAHDAVTGHRGVARHCCHDRGEHLDPAPVAGASKDALRVAGLLLSAHR